MAFSAKSGVSVVEDRQKQLKVNKYVRIILRSLTVPQSHKNLTWDSGRARVCKTTLSLAIDGAKQISDEQLTKGPDLLFLTHGKPSLRFNRSRGKGLKTRSR